MKINASRDPQDVGSAAEAMDGEKRLPAKKIIAPFYLVVLKRGWR